MLKESNGVTVNKCKLLNGFKMTTTLAHYGAKLFKIKVQQILIMN